MPLRGRHNKPGSTESHEPGKHGGPTTGTGRTGGRKPDMSEVQIPGVTGKAASMAARVLKSMRSKDK